MSYQKLSPVLQQLYVALILFTSICSCSQKSEGLLTVNDNIIEFISKTRKRNIAVSEKLKLYDSLRPILYNKKNVFVLR